jgi:uncharacterized protein (DUF1501 family)
VTSYPHSDCPEHAGATGPEQRHATDDGPRQGRTRAELLRHGPNLPEAAIRVRAESVTAALAAQRDRWREGFTRRRVIAGAGAVGVASLGTQLVTTQVAFGAPDTTRNTLIVVFLRGGQDGLSMLVPAGDPNLLRARPNIAIPAATLLPAGRGFGLNPNLAPLQPFWTAGQMAAVPAVASPDVSRSHFQAQDCIERGAATTSVHTGWLNRVLALSGPGTTFRAIAEGTEMPRSLVGEQDKIVLDGIDQFRLNGGDAKTMEALATLYTGLNHPLEGQAKVTLQAITAAQRISTNRTGTVKYPGGGFADSLSDVALLIKAQVGLKVATINVGGWDMHTNIGKVDNGDMKNQLTALATGLAAFATDLGPLLDNVTLVTMTEFGRRVLENGNGGTDHGHGGVMLLLGGGLNGGQVHGVWPGLAPGALDQGDVARANDFRDVLGEAIATRLGIGDIGAVFPDHGYKRLGAFK